jgi:hypothetical protein
VLSDLISLWGVVMKGFGYVSRNNDFTGYELAAKWLNMVSSVD